MQKYILPDNAFPVIPDEFVEKGWKTLPIDSVPVSPAKSFFEDPFSSIQSYGYRQKRWAPTYKLLKLAVYRTGILAGIINTRANQGRMFSDPFRMKRTLGFMIKHKDPSHELTRSEQNFVLELEDFIFNCGRGDRNPFVIRRRNKFSSFLHKFIRDRLSLDQACFEINPDKNGMPYEFISVDGATVRIASNNRDGGDLLGFRSPYDLFGRRPSLLTAQANRVMRDKLNRPISYVQVLDGRIVNTYTDDEMAFCPYNLDPDIHTYGYGVPEIEQIIKVLTGVLNAESYNFNFFTNASVPKGIFVIKSPIEGDMLEAFKRQFEAMTKGVENAWRTPILQTDQAEFINLAAKHTDAEFIKWLEYLIRIICAVYLIDPAEINFDISGQQPAQVNFDTQAEWRVKKSKDRGLRPLLKFIVDSINIHVVSRVAPGFYLDFVGLDDLSQKEKQDLLAQQTTLYRTINETRHDEDLPELPFGNIPANPIYLQNMQMVLNQQMQEAMMKQQGSAVKKSGNGENLYLNYQIQQLQTTLDRLSYEQDQLRKALGQ